MNRKPNRSGWLPLVLGCVVITPLACASDETVWQGVMRDSAGITIVENQETGAWVSESVPRIEEELRIGGAEVAPEYQFTAPVDIDVDAQGNIYVLDQQTHTVRVFDGAGKWQRSLGAPGSGPGELSAAAAAVALAPGDTVLVADPRNRRVTSFGPDGRAAGSFSLGVSGYALRFASLADGWMIEQMRHPRASIGDQLVVRDARGIVQDTLLTLPKGRGLVWNGRTAQFRFYESEPFWTVGSAGQIIVALTSEYRIEIHGADGSLERVITRPHRRIAITDTDRTNILGYMRQSMAESGASPAAIDSLTATTDVAEFFPAFAYIASGPGGTIWVQQVRTEPTPPDVTGRFRAPELGARQWDVFDGDGRLQGTVELPERFVPFHATADHFYGVQRDELDVPYVVRLRIAGLGAVAATPVQHRRGETWFNASCAQCHGMRALGTERGPPFVDRIYKSAHHGDAAFQMAAQRGVRAHHWRFGDMPAVAVSAEQVTAITEYVRWLQREAGIQ